MEKICCRCKKNEHDGQWVPVKDENRQNFSYGFCPTCYQETLAEIKMASQYRFRKTADLAV